MRRGDVVIERFRTRKTGALLALLAYANRSQARETLIEEIWPNSSLETGRNNLRLALAALRRIMESDGEAGACVRADRSLVALIGVETDVGELEALLHQAATASHRVPLLERALELYRGPLLPGFYENWISTAAARLETLASAALETLLSDLQAQGENARALEWAHRGAERGLVAELQANQPARIVAEKTTGATPIFLSRFFGRERELQQLDSHLSAPQISPWLLTIIGSGGAGKTRLACQALQDGQTSSLWITLEGLTETARLDEALVAALGIATPPARAPLDCAVEALQDGAPLLCFDNFEHLLPAGADWLAQLKARVAGLRVLATSRARLELDGEALLEIGALELPESAAPADIAASAAAALFLDRAGAVNPDFSLSKTNEVEFARLLRQLDGLPLALELAAARAGILSPAQMLRRLQSDADLPPISRNRAPRHHSLSATLSWSLELLDEPQRALLANLSVFCAPFDLESAHASAAPDADESEVLGRIARLRDASLLRAVPDGEPEQRFVLLETVRAGARRLLNAQERADLARRHALYFAQLAERIETNIGANQDLQLPLEKVWPDLSAALEWAARAGEAAIGLRLASALWLFWRLGGRLTQGRAHLEKLLALPELGHDDSDRLRARGATVAGFLALQMGDYAIAENHLIRAVEAASEQPDIRAWALNLSGTSAQRQGRSSAACVYFAQSLELYRDAPPHQRAVGMTALAGALVADGQTEAARIYCRDARVLWRALDDTSGQGWVEEIEGRTALSANDLVLARAHLETSLQLRRDAGAHTAAAIGTLDAMGEPEQREGHFETAQANYQSALTKARELGLRAEIASALSGLGAAAHALGETENARRAWQEALVLWRDIGDTGRAQACQDALRELALSNSPASVQSS